MARWLIELGPGIAIWLVGMAAQLSGYSNAAIALGLLGLAMLFLVAPATHYIDTVRKKQGLPTLSVVQLITLIGIGGTWLFLTMTLAGAAWTIWRGYGLSTEREAPLQQAEGPLNWHYTLTMEGGALQRRNVFALKFRGQNISEKEVRLKKATIISAIKGTELPLEVEAGGEIVPPDQIELIPPGAPIVLIAKFGPPDPAHLGKILGIDPKLFLETWRQFFLNVEDNTRNYRLFFNEGLIAPFFPGMVGPHISKKVPVSDQ